MADDVLRIERRERIAILTLNRPDRLNALSVALREALTRACQELRDDDSVWAVVLSVTSGRVFARAAIAVANEHLASRCRAPGRHLR
jgi:enoyl-CoA hydratase/carnithine racemase